MAAKFGRKTMSGAKSAASAGSRPLARPLAADHLCNCVYAVTILLLLFQVVGMFVFDLL
jgi:hypothetical protein